MQVMNEALIRWDLRVKVQGNEHSEEEGGMSDNGRR